MYALIDTSFESHQQWHSSDKFSYCPIRHKYWKTWIKRHFSGLCYLLKLRSPQFLGLSESHLMESRKTDCQTLSYPLAPWATERAVELERNENERRNERRIQMVLVWIWGPVHADSAGHCCAHVGCLSESSVWLVVWQDQTHHDSSEYWMKRVNFTADLPWYVPHCSDHYEITKCL